MKKERWREGGKQVINGYTSGKAAAMEILGEDSERSNSEGKEWRVLETRLMR